MGRLVEQKGFDRLISAFAINKGRFPDWNLLILGEGYLRPSLEAQLKNLGVADRIFLVGNIPDPFPLLRKCHIFVLSSRFEGFGNVLIEAMACGLPAISFDCPSGPSEIITDGVDGFLVQNDDIEALAKAMFRLMDNETERKRFGVNALHVRERFGLSNIMEQWKELIEEVI